MDQEFFFHSRRTSASPHLNSMYGAIPMAEPTVSRYIYRKGWSVFHSSFVHQSIKRDGQPGEDSVADATVSKQKCRLG